MIQSRPPQTGTTSASSFRTDSMVVSTFFLPVVERQRTEAGQQRGKFSDLPHHPVAPGIVPAIGVFRHLHAVRTKLHVGGLPVSLCTTFAIPAVVNVSNHHQRRVGGTDPFARGIRHPRRADAVAVFFLIAATSSSSSAPLRPAARASCCFSLISASLYMAYSFAVAAAASSFSSRMV